MDDGHRWWVARLVAAIVVALAAWFSEAVLLLAGAGGGTAGSLFLWAAPCSSVAGLLVAVGAAALARYREATNPRSVWLFRLAAAALLPAAVLVFAAALSVWGHVSFPETLGAALFMALLALATPWWGHR